MEGDLKDYEEEWVEEGTFHSDPATEVGEWEVQDLDHMETQLNNLMYETCHFIPVNSSIVSTPRPKLAS